MSGNLEAAEVMAANDELIAALFPHMRTIFDLAGSLIEEILAVRITPFDLRKVGTADSSHVFVCPCQLITPLPIARKLVRDLVQDEPSTVLVLLQDSHAALL